jgi:lipopolysaccharide biosynthesis protein
MCGISILDMRRSSPHTSDPPHTSEAPHVCLRVAVCFHVGYISRFAEFTPYIDHVMATCCQVDLYLSYREEIDPSTLHTKYPNAILLKAVRGCDVGAFLLQVYALLQSGRNYDYVFKIHTKSNNVAHPHWVESLLHPIAGTKQRVQHTLRLFSRYPRLGLIGSRRWILDIDITDPIFTDLCQRLHIDPRGGYYVGGTGGIRTMRTG